MIRSAAFIMLTFVLLSCSKDELSIKHGKLVLTFNNKLHTYIAASDGKPLMQQFIPSDYILAEEFTAKDFDLESYSSEKITDSIGNGSRWKIHGIFRQDQHVIEKRVVITLYDSLPEQAFFKTTYFNRGERNVNITQWVSNEVELLPEEDSVAFWSFQGESTGERKDWILPVKGGFRQQNFMGMNNTDYGGGIPVVDLWRKDNGVAVGHIELTPELVSLPVSVDAYTRRGRVSITKKINMTMRPLDSLQTITTFIHFHTGDYFTALSRYGAVLRKAGMKFAEPEPEAFEPAWCAWGYMRNFTIDEIIGTLPKVRSMGIKWVTIDDGFQQAEGDWHVNSKTFPNGDKQMRALVDRLHEEGFKVMLWWAPLAADPDSKLLRTHPDLKSLTSDGAPHYITWWDSYYLAPAYDKTKEHTSDMLKLFFQEWNVDGLKMDGQHLNAVHEDHNPVHGLQSPQQNITALPEFFRFIYEEATAMKPGAVLQLCPCGTCMSVFNMPYTNQTVASDPLSSWQIRHKGKTYKAMMHHTAYFGDHVELSDGRNDFASSFGIGAVPGTKFTWPKENPSVTEDNILTQEKEAVWSRWFSLYRRKELSKADYRGDLYDIGYDLPETHVIQKGDTLHYAFYSKTWNGDIELKGLTSESYRLRDYVNDVDYGVVRKNNPILKVAFEKSLLIEAYPE